ncbi:MAG: 50S ribosomal protein L29 [Candidatus Magasanikbacteria bacterium]
MEIQDLKNKSIKELHELLLEKRNKLRELKFQASEKQLKNVTEIKKVRKVVARILTLLNSSKKQDQK